MTGEVAITEASTDWPLSYCADIHPADDLAGLLAQLDDFATPIRLAVPLDRLGIGLRLAPPVATALAGDRSARRRLRTELTARSLEVVTLDASPLAGVLGPTWSNPARLRYTVDCAAVLADLLPDRAAYGTISTLALGGRNAWSPTDDAAAMATFDALSGVLRTIDTVHGRPVTLAVEPQPGCVLETVAEAVAWLAGRVDPRHVGLCLDACHLAVSFADPATAVSGVYRAGLAVLKVQAAAALHLDRPDDPAVRAALAGLWAPVWERGHSGRPLAAADFAAAVADLPGQRPWRIDVHLPLHTKPAAPFRATRKVVRATVAAVLAEAGPAEFPPVEVETFPFPTGPRPATAGIVADLAADLAWVASVLDDAGVATVEEVDIGNEADGGAPSLGARSLAGPMTRVGGAWIGR